MIYEEYQRIAYIALEIREFKYFIKGQSLSRLAFFFDFQDINLIKKPKIFRHSDLEKDTKIECLNK